MAMKPSSELMGRLCLHAGCCLLCCVLWSEQLCLHRSSILHACYVQVLHNAIRYALLLPAAAAALDIFSWWWFPFSILPLIEVSKQCAVQEP